MAKKKKSAKRSKPLKRKAVTRPKKISIPKRKSITGGDMGIGAINQHITIARHGLEHQLKNKMLQQYNAGTKMDKKRIGKEITALKTKIKKLK